MDFYQTLAMFEVEQLALKAAERVSEVFRTNLNK
jgi:hypothetical protein